MSSTLKRIFTIGATLTIVGSFLPWQLSGDFAPIWTYGITLHPFVKDSGGFLVVLFTALVIVLIYRPPEFVKRPNVWSVAFSLALVFDAFFHIGELLWVRSKLMGLIGAPTIRLGLVMVLVGAMLLLYATVQHYRETVRNDELDGGK